MKPDANVTIVFATEQENGVLLYDGQSEHLAVELFNGRIRISYDVGNYPVSTMYRYAVPTFNHLSCFVFYFFFVAAVNIVALVIRVIKNLLDSYVGSVQYLLFILS